jgi:hypothetical protein
VAVQITPEPTPEERQALLEALEAAGQARDEGSAWWQAGIREAVGEEQEES